MNTDVKSLTVKIHDRVHSLYDKKPTNEQMELWISLIKMCSEIDPHIEIFTTNYDLVIDATIVRMRKNNLTTISTGRIGDGLQTNINEKLWEIQSEDNLAQEGKGLLTKLHGSVDWHRSESLGISCCLIPTEKRRSSGILYPGSKDARMIPPFGLFYHYLEEMTRHTNRAIFVGFSFGDEEINRILSNIGNKVPKIAINPDSNMFAGPPPPPGLGSAFIKTTQHYKMEDGFSQKAIDYCKGILEP